MVKLDVLYYPKEALVHPFTGDAPYYTITDGHVSHERVDPFPGYAHDIHLVNDHLQHVAKQAPINVDVRIHLLSHECIGRTNGYARSGKYYDNEQGKEAAARGVERWGQIVFSGKRIPPHPGVTKYLVAHEYGHLVEDWLERDQKDGDIKKMYAELRGIKYTGNESYGGGTWHKSIGELFANDFRILVCRTEVNFWPHDGIDRPETLPAVQRFWTITQKDLLTRGLEKAAA